LSTKNLFIKGLYKMPGKKNFNFATFAWTWYRRWKRERYDFFTYARKIFKQNAWNRYMRIKKTRMKKLKFHVSKLNPVRFNLDKTNNDYFKQPMDAATYELWNDPTLFPLHLLKNKKKKTISNYIKLLKKRYKLRQFYYKNKFYNFKTWLGFYCGQIFRTTKFKQWLAYSRSNLAVYYPYRMFPFKSRRYKSITWRPYKVKPYVKKNSRWHKEQRRLHFKRVRLFRQACWVPEEKAAPLRGVISPDVIKSIPFIFFKPGPRVFAWFYLIDSFFFWIIYFFHLFFLLYLKTLMIFDCVIYFLMLIEKIIFIFVLKIVIRLVIIICEICHLNKFHK
jgi:hypothetical protein